MVNEVSLDTKFFGVHTKLPVYLTACALGRLAHPDGEMVLTRAAGSRGVIQMMPTLASCSLEEMVGARRKGQPWWYQIYVNSDRKKTEELVKKAVEWGVGALAVTVDAPQLGRREKDMRLKFVDSAPSAQEESGVGRSQGAARAISTFIDPSLSWKSLSWLRSLAPPSIPLLLKGVQTPEDAILAAKSGLVQGIIVSNHGGRQLDTVPSGIEMLADIMLALERAGLKDKLEVYVDGGFRRGSDIFKALALGAKGVGIGRPALYAMGAYGVPGVERMLDILGEEMEMVMRLMGVTKISEITKDLVNIKDLGTHVGGAGWRDGLVDSVYEPLRPVVSSSKL
ncbi:hypothetical protein HDV05_003365 [Chytridiales sp. JEL 0842]|nr:hypothetical protein HDV05_003365 [Chytridiales sp. JEL 0842]